VGVVNQNFFDRLFNAYAEDFNPQAAADAPATATASPACLTPPLESPPFPSGDFPYGGNPGMCQDGTAVRGPLMKALGPTSFGKFLDDNKISIYGWVAPSINVSSSGKVKGGNAPAAYYYDANRGLFDQGTFYIERLPDTTQTDHVDYGFRITNIYGSDYRYTTMYGLSSNSYLAKNHQNGWDIPMAYVDLYVPTIGYGTNFQLGRYISLPDIEAQLAPNNYFFSHSLLYTIDPYTQVGLVSTTKLDPKGQWMLQLGLSAGNDVTPWAGHNLAQPTMTVGLRYTTSDNKDNLYVVANSINDGKFGYNNLQSYYATYYHIFPNPKWHTATETWYMYQKGTPTTNGGLATPFTSASGTPFGYGVNGPYGAYCRTGTQCRSEEYAILNYTLYEIDHRNFVGMRNEVVNDQNGQRTGFKTMYYEGTVGWNHYFSDDLYIRPELGYYHAFNARAFNNGTRKDQLVLATDLIFRY